MADRPRVFHPDDLFALRTVTEVALSPDGRRAAVTINFADRDKDEYRSFVALVDLGTGTLRPLTQVDKRSSNPVFSPDGTSLAFVSDRSGAAQLWVMPLDGGEPSQRTFFKNGASSPRWSPDGKQIAFLSSGGEREQLKDGKDGKKDEKPPVKVLKRVRYREDGRGFYHDKPNHVFVVGAYDGEPKQLTDGDDDDRAPAWSRDGTTIAFIANRTDDPSSDVTDVWLVSSRGGELRRLTPSAQAIDVPQWSPDGTKLCVLGEPHVRSVGYSARVGFISRDGGAPRFVTDPQTLNFASLVISVGHAGWFQPPKWTPQGVIALANTRGRQNLYLVNERGQVQPISQGDQAVFAFDASADGSTVAFTASQQDDPVNVYVQKHGEKPRRVSDLNPWLAQLQAPEIESLVYTSDDGTALDAWLAHPPFAARSERLPLLLLIHGGPHCAYGYAFNRNAIAYAAAGYRVLFVNPRGSAGYGENFARAIHPQQGDIDQRDLLAGVAAAVLRGGVDEGRIGITGGSYGGYMTNLLLGRSDRFAAGVTLCCVSNWVSFYGTCDFGWALAWEFEKELWEDARRYVSQSPLTYAANIRAPLLILHGEDDLRCPIEQGEQLFALLARRGAKCEMRRYPGEPHAIGSKRPTFAVDVLASTLSWFDTHLKVAERQPELVEMEQRTS